jgi:hypothetical protein
MRRFAASVSMVCIIGCGSSGGIAPWSPPGEDRVGGPTGSIPVALSSAADIAKVVLKRSTTTDQVVMVSDGDTAAAPVTCVPGGTECDGYSASCKGGVCTRSVTRTSIFYVKNFDPVTSETTFRVPCDGNEYAVETYGAAQAGKDAIVTEVYTASVNLASDCSVTTAPAWNRTPDTALARFTFPDAIYVGLDEPYDRYTLTVAHASYPWSPNDWTLTCDGSAPFLGKTTFHAPALSTNPPPLVTCTGVYPMDRSIRLPDEPAWFWRYTESKAPTNTGGLPLP